MELKSFVEGGLIYRRSADISFRFFFRFPRSPLRGHPVFIERGEFYCRTDLDSFERLVDGRVFSYLLPTRVTPRLFPRYRPSFFLFSDQNRSRNEHLQQDRGADNNRTNFQSRRAHDPAISVLVYNKHDTSVERSTATPQKKFN